MKAMIILPVSIFLCFIISAFANAKDAKLIGMDNLNRIKGSYIVVYKDDAVRSKSAVTELIEDKYRKSIKRVYEGVTAVIAAYFHQRKSPGIRMVVVNG
jgi:hypothetical protein